MSKDNCGCDTQKKRVLTTVFKFDVYILDLNLKFVNAISAIHAINVYIMYRRIEMFFHSAQWPIDNGFLNHNALFVRHVVIIQSSRSDSINLVGILTQMIHTCNYASTLIDIIPFFVIGLSVCSKSARFRIHFIKSLLE